MMGARRWKSEEDEIVRQIHASDKTAKECAHLLPGRSHFAIMGRFMALGLPRRGGRGRSHYRWVEEAMVKALSSGHSLTAHELAAATGASYHRVRVTLYEGRGTKFHVFEWTRVYEKGNWTPKWVLGPGVDAPAPKPLTAPEIWARDRQRRKLKAANPFSVALGQVKAPESVARTVVHLYDEMEAA
ncbi:hypothetical protein [Burkholderia multivorans]|uniref:hypothetical protein n=1 Tax=Burkholderia multivorans TaxID=87883 RepID=UPI0011B286BB|nr:hypothetical protein [Burkholderia multivorans]